MRMFEENRKVQDKVGPLEGSDGNIITEGFLMAENLYEYFSSMVTREDISILPVLETKFEGRKKQTLYHYLKKVRETSQRTIDQ